MAREPIISVSGLRGIVGDTLTPDVAHRYAAAFAQTLPAGPVVVTRDGRANGGPLVGPVAAGLSQHGTRPVLDGGVAATPTTGVLVRDLRCAGGLQISASHNPAEYNGFKLFSHEGRVVPASAGLEVLKRYQASSPAPAAVDETAELSLEQIADTTSAHLNLLTSVVDVDRIRSQRFSVLLDANHGSGALLGGPLLNHLGCGVHILGGEPNGQFAHIPEPTAENLQTILPEVPRRGAAIGFCQDPDADRLAIIDERGAYIGEEYTLALCVEHVLRTKRGPVVTNCSTSRMTEDIAAKHGVPFTRSAVGEANVVDAMLRESAILGGEGNGGVIDPRVGLVRDSFVAMALVLDTMAVRNVAVSQLVADLPRYAIYKAKFELPRERMPSAFDSIANRFPDAAIDRLDGLRLDWSDLDGGPAWLLIRGSNTEPVVRIIAEARTVTQAESLCDDAAAALSAAT